MMTKKKIKQMLNESDLEITFTKKDGTTRVLRCTGNVPLQTTTEPLEDSVKKVRVQSDELMSVYDTEAHGWRSFRVESVQSVIPLDTQYGLLQE